MFSSANKHRLTRSTRTAKPLRWYYQAKEPKPRSSYYSHDARQTPYLTSLPPELQLSIFDHLDPASSTCLGLTSKKLYPLHRAVHKKVGLYEGSEVPLCLLLKDWAPPNLVLDWETEKLVTRERLDILDEVRRRERKRRENWQPGSYNSGSHMPQVEYDRYYQPFHPQPEERRRRLRRCRRFERHDIWSLGRRR